MLRQAALEACPSWLSSNWQCLNWKVLFWKRCSHLSGSLQALPSFAAAKTAGGIENHILGWPSRNATAKVGVCVCVCVCVGIGIFLLMRPFAVATTLTARIGKSHAGIHSLWTWEVSSETIFTTVALSHSPLDRLKVLTVGQSGSGA